MCLHDINIITIMYNFAMFITRKEYSILNGIEILQITSHFHHEMHCMLREAYVTIFSI